MSLPGLFFAYAMNSWNVFAGSEGLIRHYLEIEAGSPEDAVLVARGALAVAGGEGTDFQVEEAPGA